MAGKSKPVKEIGCIACLLIAGETRPCDAHHPYGRKGDNKNIVIGLCPYHHRGLIDDGWNSQDLSGKLGPSFAWGRRNWTANFGTDEVLLQIQSFLNREFHKSAWPDYNPPHEVRREARSLWEKLRK